MSKRKSLPKTVYVKREEDENDPDGAYLVANETPDSMDDGDVVGIYELKETRTVAVTRALK